MMYRSRYSQHGATLIVGLIMLSVITVMVATAFSLSTTNLKAVGNMQFRNDAIAAANKAMEQVLSSPFTGSPKAEVINVDMNNDDKADYKVELAAPTCIRAMRAGTTKTSEYTLGEAMSQVSDWNTVWEIDAVVKDEKSGASIRTRSGVRVVRSDSQKKAECP